MPPSERAIAALATLAAAIPGGERRVPQEQMAAAVADAIGSGRHLLAQAGTGTGKSFAYLVPAILAGKRVVVATATKALQDQLAGKDLPFLEAHLGREVTFAVLKGRSNYVCRQRIAEISGAGQLALDGLADRASPSELSALKLWAASTPTGDRAELSAEPSPQAWAAVSVSAQECPGARRCPSGGACFAEAARQRAAEADVVVVNLHLLGLDLATGGAILPEHHLVVVDEAHQLEDVISDTSGYELSAGRFANLARSVRAILDDPAAVDDLETSGDLLSAVLTEHVDRRLRGSLPVEVADALALIRARLDRVMASLRNVPDDAPDEVKTRKERAVQLTTTVMADVVGAAEVPDTSVAWVEGPSHHPKLCVAPLDVSELLRARLWEQTTTVLTSATLPAGLADRVGLAAGTFDQLDVGSPFDYDANGLLYCAAHLPDPRSDALDPAVHDELRAHRRRRRAHARAVHLVPVDGPRRGGPAGRAARARPVAARPAEAGPRRGVHHRRVGQPLRHHGLLAGHRRPRPHPLARHHRPPPVPPPRRAAAAGPARAGPGRRLPADRPAPHGDDAGTGRRTADPVARGPRRRRRVRSPAGHGQALPLGPDQRAPAVPPDQGSSRGRGVPARPHGMMGRWPTSRPHRRATTTCGRCTSTPRSPAPPAPATPSA
ncbi:MAG: ATP-dependent DNA helicase [Acidimicrobiales bacterium]